MNLAPYLELAKQHTNKDIFGIFLYGSQNYGLQDSQSDIDIRCLVFPDSMESEILQSVEVVFPNEERIEYVDIRSFFSQLFDKSLTLLETLVTGYYIIDKKYDYEWTKLKLEIDNIGYSNPQKFWEEIYQNTRRHKYKYEHHMGPPALFKKCGYSAKSLAHLYRYRDILMKYNNNESFNTIFLISSKDVFMDIKRGRWSRAMADAAFKEITTFLLNKACLSTNIKVTNCDEAKKIIESIYTKRRSYEHSRKITKTS